MNANNLRKARRVVPWSQEHESAFGICFLWSVFLSICVCVCVCVCVRDSERERDRERQSPYRALSASCLQEDIETQWLHRETCVVFPQKGYCNPRKHSRGCHGGRVGWADVVAEGCTEKGVKRERGGDRIRVRDWTRRWALKKVKDAACRKNERK